MPGRTGAGLTRLALAAGFATAVVFCPTRTEAGEAKTKVNVAALVRETQKMTPEANQVKMVWWIPTEYWEACLAQNPIMTPDQIAQFAEILRPYVVVIVVEGTVGVFGTMTFKTEAEVRARVKLRDKDENLYMPLEAGKIGAELTSLLAMMKPMLAASMGPMGKNMHFFVFPAKDKKGQSIADAKKEGSFTVVLGEDKYRWRLPLGSLLPEKVCPECAEKLSGAFKFCPYDGAKLPVTQE